MKNKLVDNYLRTQLSIPVKVFSATRTVMLDIFAMLNMQVNCKYLNNFQSSRLGEKKKAGNQTQAGTGGLLAIHRTHCFNEFLG